MIEAKVVSGQARGRLLGFPTLNLKPNTPITAPHGIYAGQVSWQGRTYQGAFHWGPIPTFDQSEPVLEVFVLDTAITATPTQVSFSLDHKLRDIVAFKTKQKLIDQIKQDVEQTRKVNTKRESINHK